MVQSSSNKVKTTFTLKALIRFLPTMEKAEVLNDDMEERKTEYIPPLPYKIIITVFAVSWSLLLMLKLFCQDEEWGFFLIFTSHLLVFLLPFFVTSTMELVMDMIIGVKDQDSSSASHSVTSSDSSSSAEEPLPIKKSPRTKKQVPRGLFGKEATKKTKKDKKEIEKNGPRYTLFKREEVLDNQQNADGRSNSEDEKIPAQYTLFKREEEIFKKNGEKTVETEEEEVKVEARLEIIKVLSSKPGIVVDPNDDAMHVDVQVQVEVKDMDVQSKASNDGDELVEVKAEIEKGDAKDEDKVELEVETADTENEDMKLKTRKKTGEGIKGSKDKKPKKK